MNSIEAVSCMKQGKRITYGNKTNFWYELYSNGSVYSFLQDTACAAKVLGIWDTTDDFIRVWDRSGGSWGPGELQLYDNVG